MRFRRHLVIDVRKTRTVTKAFVGVASHLRNLVLRYQVGFAHYHSRVVSRRTRNLSQHHLPAIRMARQVVRKGK